MTTSNLTGYLGKATPNGREIIDAGLPKRVIDLPHYEIHEGEAYAAWYSALKDSTEIIEVRIQTADSPIRPHLLIAAESALASTVEVWCPTTMTHVVPNAIVPTNRNMDSSNTSLVTACHTPGGAQAGVAWITRYMGSASASGKTDVGGGLSSRSEFILPRDTSLLIRMTSRADNNALTIILDWYEHELTV